MEFQQLAQRRASCRQFRPDPIAPETLEALVELACLAPSPANAQPWRFIAVTQKPLLEQMARAVERRTAEVFPQPKSAAAAEAMKRLMWFSTFFAQAPAVIFVTLSPYRAVVDEAVEGCESPTHDEINELRMRPDLQCIGAAIEHILLGATDLGLGGCWLSAPLIARRELEATLGLEPPWQLASMVAVGKPAVLLNTEKIRKPVSEVFELIP